MGRPGTRRLTEGDPFTLFCWLLLLGLSANGEVCGPDIDIDITNYISEFQRLEKCTVVEGNLLIQFININQELLRSLSFPKLTVITDFLMLYDVSGLDSLSTLFPNLSVIRGHYLFHNYALVILEMPDLKDVGLYNLRSIPQGAVWIKDNPKLCYLDSVDWSLIMDTKFNNSISGNKQECSDVCPGVVENRPQCGRTMFNHYNYRCWSSSHCQKVWAKVELTMNDTVDTVEMYKDDTVQISCHYNFTDNAKPAIIQWMVKAANSSQRIFHGNNDQQMVDRNTEYSERIQVTSDQQSSVLTLRGVRLSDEGLFICQVNGLGSGSAEGRTLLRVFAPPLPPVIEGVLTGISVTNETLSKVASCEARGFPKPNITWYRNHLPLVPAQGHVNMVTLATQEPEGFFTVQSELQYKVVKEDQDSRFTCEVSYLVPEGVRTAKSRDINITVHYLDPVVVVPRDLAVLIEGQSLTATCNAQSSLETTAVWYKNGKQVERGHTLTLVDATSATAGEYVCEVTVSALPALHSTGSVHIIVLPKRSMVLIAVIILALLLLAVLGSIIYFMDENGKIPCCSEKREIKGCEVTLEPVGAVTRPGEAGELCDASDTQGHLSLAGCSSTHPPPPSHLVVRSC